MLEAMKNVTISMRLYALVALFLAILAAALTFSLFESYREMERERKAGLAAMNETAVAIIKQYYQLEQGGSLTRRRSSRRKQRSRRCVMATAAAISGSTTCIPPW